MYSFSQNCHTKKTGTEQKYCRGDWYGGPIIDRVVDVNVRNIRCTPSRSAIVKIQSSAEYLAGACVSQIVKAD